MVSFTLTWSSLTSAGWPSTCQICGLWFRSSGNNRAWCNDCQQSCAPQLARCVHCALPAPHEPHEADAAFKTSSPYDKASAHWRCGACASHPNPWQWASAAVSYTYPWADMIARLKYQQDSALAKPLAHLMVQDRLCRDTLACADVWLGVPITHRKLGLRGFNQTDLLLDHIAGALAHCKAAGNWATTRPLVQRRDHGPSQQGLGRQQRLRNLKGAFSLTPAGVQATAGRHVVLVDDVYTTGATLTALASAVQQAQPASVHVCVVARTPQNGARDH